MELPFLDDAPKVERNEAFIAAPRAAVFAKIGGDPANWGEWFPGFNGQGRWETDPPFGPGSVRTVNAFRTAYRETILAYDTDERFAFRVDETSSALFAAFAEDYRLSDKAGGTLLTWTVAYKPALVMRIAGPLAPWTFRRMTKQVGAGLTRVAPEQK